MKSLDTALKAVVSGEAVLPVTAGLAGHWDATKPAYTDDSCSVQAGLGDAVGCFPDQSGNGRNATNSTAAEKPVLTANAIGTKPALRFDGASGNDDGLGFDGSFLVSTAFTVFAVVRFANGSSANEFIIGGGTAAANQNLHLGYNASALMVQAQFANDVTGAQSSRDTANGDIHSYVQSATEREMFVNGVSKGADANTTLLSAFSGAEIGRRADAAATLDGDIGELIIYDSALTDAQRRQVESYLSNKWGIAVDGDYQNKFLTTKASNQVLMLTLGETVGTTGVDRSGNNADATYAGGVAADNAAAFDGTPAGFWDGVNDYVTLDQATMDGPFDPTLGSLAIWCKVNDSSVWTDGASRIPIHLGAAVNNRIFWHKTTASNQLFGSYRAAGTNENHTESSFSETGWFHLGMRWNVATADLDLGTDSVDFWVNGIKVSTSTGLGTWSGALALAWTALSSFTGASPSEPWHGWLKYAGVWNTVLSDAEMLALATQ